MPEQANDRAKLAFRQPLTILRGELHQAAHDLGPSALAELVAMDAGG
jgi:hypothetical protein